MIGKTISKVEESNKLNEGIKITFTDGTVFECCWNYNEGYLNEPNKKHMDRFKKYQRKQIAELRPVTKQEISFFKTDFHIPTDMEYDVSISDADLENGSPRLGDMIGRNPKNHNDQWLVARDYFENNFEVVSNTNDRRNSANFHAKKIIEKLTTRPFLQDDEGFVDINADEKQMIDIVEKYISNNFK